MFVFVIQDNMILCSQAISKPMGTLQNMKYISTMNMVWYIIVEQIRRLELT